MTSLRQALAQVKWKLLRATRYKDAVYHPKAEDRPFMVRLDVNNSCNLLCKLCFYPEFAKKGGRRDYMSPEDFESMAEKLFPYVYSMQFACSFEAMMHPDYARLLEIMDRYAIPHVGTVTNGTLLKGKKAEALLRSRSIKLLSISLDAIKPETYRLLRGRPLLKEVLQNIENFLADQEREGKPYPRLLVNARIMASNLEELPRLVEWCGERGILDMHLLQVLPFSPENEESLARDPERYNTMRQNLLETGERLGMRLVLPEPIENGTEGEIFQPPPQETNGIRRLPVKGLNPHPYPQGVFCVCPWMTLGINAQGELTPCSHRFEYRFGNILHQSLFNAINTPDILRLRKAMLQAGGKSPCPHCSVTMPYSDPMASRAPTDHLE